MNKRGFMKDMNREDLFKMRDSGMSNKAIAVALGCSYQTVLELIGKQPKDITSASCRVAQLAAHMPSKGGYTVERKMKSFKSQREEADEPVKAVLAVKKTPIRLSGAFMHYTICPGREMVDVETEEGRTLIQVSADMLGTFIEELTAIQKNMNTAQSVPFWG